MVAPPNERHNSIKGIVDAAHRGVGRGKGRGRGGGTDTGMGTCTVTSRMAARTGCLISRQPCHILNKQYKQSALLQKVTGLIGWQLAAAAAVGMMLLLLLPGGLPQHKLRLTLGCLISQASRSL